MGPPRLTFLLVVRTQTTVTHFLIVMCFTTGQQILSEEELLIQLAIQQSLADSELNSGARQESWAQVTGLSNSEDDLQR